MQVVISLPDENANRLDVPVCGVPLLVRVMSTALDAGGTSFLLLHGPGMAEDRIHQVLRLPVCNQVRIESACLTSPFNPSDAVDWLRIETLVDEQFLWIPSNYVPHVASLVRLLSSAAEHPHSSVRFWPTDGSHLCARLFKHPAVFSKADLTERRYPSFESVGSTGEPGVSVSDLDTVREAEMELVRRSGTPTDSLYSHFSRKLCGPAARWLSRTQVSLNAFTFVRLSAAVFATLCFARGSWASDVAGGTLFFISGLFDELKGMLATLHFKESARTGWLDTWVDHMTYMLVFTAMTIGLYRRGGEFHLLLGAVLMIGTLVSFVLIAGQRRLAAPGRTWRDYYRRHLSMLERDVNNPISLIVRNFHFLTRKGVLIYYILLFAVLRGTSLFLLLAAIGANMTWMVTAYFNARFYSPLASRQPVAVPRYAFAAHTGRKREPC